MADDSNVQIVQNPEPPVLDTIHLGIEGMTCERCAQKVEKALREASGVSEVKVDLGKAQATVTFDTRVTDVPRLHDTLLRSGYRPSATPAPA